MKTTRKAGKIEALTQAIKGLGSAEGRVGWFPSAVYEGGQPVAGVAAVQEFGSEKRSIPPRPFMRPTAEEKSQEWAQIAAPVVRAAALGKIKPESVMTAVTLAAEGAVREKLGKIMDPPLSRITLLARMERKKGNAVTGKTIGKLAKDQDTAISGVSTKPLVDSGYLLATLTSEVTT